MSVQERYSPSDITVTWGSLVIAGFMPSSIVTVEHRVDQTQLIVGCDGLYTWVQSLDRSALITIHLSGASLTNAALSRAANLDRILKNQAFPLQIKDNAGSLLWNAESSRIVKIPTGAVGSTPGDREWQLLAGDLRGSH